VLKKELRRAPGVAAAAASIACLTPGVLRVALRGHDDDERSVFAASEGLQRALVGLVGRVAGDRERLEPALRNLGGRERAEDRESEPRADHEQAVADDLAGE